MTSLYIVVMVINLATLLLNLGIFTTVLFSELLSLLPLHPAKSQDLFLQKNAVVGGFSKLRKGGEEQ